MTPSPEAPRLDAETLFRQHATFVAGFVIRLGAAPADVDDLVQEVFLVAHRKGGFRPDRARATTWLAEIAVRLVANRRRQTSRRPVECVEDLPETQQDPSVDPFENAANREALMRVQQALDTLPLKQRAVFILFELQRESCESISEGLGVPVGTIYSRLHHARRSFKKAYDKGHSVGWLRPSAARASKNPSKNVTQELSHE